jgi:hypothetical protein
MLNRAESMQALVGVRKEVNITYKTLDETLLGTAEAIPNAEPATAQISYTVSATTHLPEMDANVAFQSVGTLYVGGRNLTASARTLSYRILKNGTSLVTGTVSCVASQYWSLKLVHASLIGVVAGDVIDVKLWCADATWLNWSYKHFACMPTRIKLFNDARKVAFNVLYYDGGVLYPIPTLGPVPYSYSTGLPQPYGCRSDATNITFATSQSNLKLMAQKEDANFGILRVYSGDVYTTIEVACHATRMPYTHRNCKTTKIAWNELFLQI